MLLTAPDLVLIRLPPFRSIALSSSVRLDCCIQSCMDPSSHFSAPASVDEGRMPAAAACSQSLQSSAPLFSTPTLSIGSLRFIRPPAKWDDGGGAVASLSAERGAINSCLPVVAVDLAAKQMPTTPACCVVTSMLPHSGVLQRGRIGPLRRQQLRELYGRIDEDKHLLCNRHHSEFYRLRGEHSAQARAKLAPSQKKRKRAFGGLTE